MDTKYTLDDIKVSLKLKLATRWVSFMLIYIYVDYFRLYMPNKVEDILKGKVFVFDITQGIPFVALALLIIAALMIFFYYAAG